MTGSSALILYCVAIAAASLGGGLAARRLKVSHLGMQLAMSFVGGLILGVAVLHMLPHAIASSPQSLGSVTFSVLLGIIGMLLLMRVFSVHQHQSDAELGAVCDHPSHAPHPLNVHNHAHGPDCDHGHDHDSEDGHQHEREPATSTDDVRVFSLTKPTLAPPTPPPSAVAPVSRSTSDSHSHAHKHGHHASASHEHGASDQLSLRWLGLAIGMTVHSLLDGIALAAFVSADRHDHTSTLWHMPAFGIFLAVLFHKPLDASSIVWLMRAERWPSRSMVAINLLFAAMTPLGALLFHGGILGSSLASDAMLAVALGFSAGVFLCISLSDILPEVQFHSHDRTKLTAALVLGVSLAWLVGLLEPSSAHRIVTPPTGLNVSESNETTSSEASDGNFAAEQVIEE